MFIWFVGFIPACQRGFVGFIRARPGCRLVPWSRRGHSGTLGSFRRAQGVVEFIPVSFRRVQFVVGFIRVGWVHLAAPLWSLGSFGFVGFVRARSGGRRVNLGAPMGSLGTFGRALGVVGII